MDYKSALPEDVYRLYQGKPGTGVVTFWCGEGNDLTVLLEHVDLLNCLNWLHIQLLQSALQLLVIGAGAFMRLFDFSSWSSFSSDSDGCSLSLEPRELGLIHDSLKLQSSDRLWERRILRQMRIAEAMERDGCCGGKGRGVWNWSMLAD